MNKDLRISYLTDRAIESLGPTDSQTVVDYLLSDDVHRHIYSFLDGTRERLMFALYRKEHVGTLYVV